MTDRDRLVKSPVETHTVMLMTDTVMLMTDEGFVLDVKCYKHDAQPAPEPESE